MAKRVTGYGPPVVPSNIKLASWGKIARREDVEVVTHLLDGEAAGSLVAFLLQDKPDLLVIGLHRRSSRIARLWSTVYEVAQEAPCSVLGVH